MSYKSYKLKRCTFVSFVVAIPRVHARKRRAGAATPGAHPQNGRPNVARGAGAVRKGGFKRGKPGRKEGSQLESPPPAIGP